MYRIMRSGQENPPPDVTDLGHGWLLDLTEQYEVDLEAREKASKKPAVP